MSLSVLLSAVRDRLRTGGFFTFADDFKCNASEYAAVIGVQNDGKPDPGFAGQRYLSIWPTQCTYGSPELSPQAQLVLAETYALTCTLTHRLEFTPEDYIPEEVTFKAVGGLYTVARKIHLALHDISAMTGAMNTTISATATDCFVTNLRWQDTETPPRPVGPEWFSEHDEKQQAFGIAIDIRFGGCSRMTCMQ